MRRAGQNEDGARPAKKSDGVLREGIVVRYALMMIPHRVGFTRGGGAIEGTISGGFDEPCVRRVQERLLHMVEAPAIAANTR